MEKFITASPSSKNALNMMSISASLPVNIVVLGASGVGKKRLVAMVFPDADSFEALELERLFREKKVDFSETKVIVVYDLNKASNSVQLIQKLEECDCRIIATATEDQEIFQEKFLVKVELPPLAKRPEDTNLLIEDYIIKAKKLFSIEEDLKDLLINVDLSKNSNSLKESIYRAVLFNSIDENEMQLLLEQFFDKVVEKKTDYKVLLEIFEKPLLKAMRKQYKSQLQMAAKLNLNRNTLRKKMYQYGLEEK